MVIFVGGINGVGKTTILTQLCQLYPEFTHIKGSTLLMEALGIKAGDYETLRNYSDEVKDRAFGSIVTDYCHKYRDSDEVILIDAHLLNLVEGKIKRVIGEWIQDVDGIVLVEAEPEVIAYRIVKDSVSRNRALFEGELQPTDKKKVEEIHQYMEQTREEHRRVVELYSMPSLIIDNQENREQETIASIYSFYCSLKK